MQVRFFEDALAEIEESRAWYRIRSESAEAAFLRELDHAIHQVADAPHRWPIYLSGTRRYVFRKFPYSLVYFTEGEFVNVVAAAHDKRRPGYWRKRLRK
jgi:plasmid stabilization system protein ParE